MTAVVIEQERLQKAEKARQDLQNYLMTEPYDEETQEFWKLLEQIGNATRYTYPTVLKYLKEELK